MRRHVEARHIDTNGFPCEQCPYVSKTRYNLVKHIRRKHQTKMDENESASPAATSSSSSMIPYLS
ncbi:Uncharacterized protein FKW44_003307 [Caligus rogercresseyi]|uniref:C2H2-type domain-containing protein n=1 Tax=Caligus rogercresseyi TaxID=217165 RepID=A0A7T8KLE3_CALRO|nr:Uncharacterized protein FKW44_003307 [Caligus rogercresseyi]